MPNWKNPDDYPGDDASRDVMKWEFLRRNPEFKKDFEENMPQEEMCCKWGMVYLCHPDKNYTEIAGTAVKPSQTTKYEFFISPHSPPMNVITPPLHTRIRNWLQNWMPNLSANLAHPMVSLMKIR